MKIYQVRIKVNKNLASEFEQYMKQQHIPDVMATGSFQRCIFAREDDENYLVQYFTDDQALQDYLENSAQRLRDDFSFHFPAGIQIFRSILEVVFET